MAIKPSRHLLIGGGSDKHQPGIRTHRHKQRSLQPHFTSDRINHRDLIASPIYIQLLPGIILNNTIKIIEPNILTQTRAKLRILVLHRINSTLGGHIIQPKLRPSQMLILLQLARQRLEIRLIVDLLAFATAISKLISEPTLRKLTKQLRSDSTLSNNPLHPRNVPLGTTNHRNNTRIARAIKTQSHNLFEVSHTGLPSNRRSHGTTQQRHRHQQQ